MRQRSDTARRHQRHVHRVSDGAGEGEDDYHAYWSPDGRRLVLRTYTDAYVYEVPGDDLVAVLAGVPTVLPLPPTRQGEAVTWTRDGAALLTSSEGVGAPVHRVPAPPPPAGGPRPATVSPAASPASAGGRGPGPLPAAAVAGALVTVLVVVLARARRHR